MILLAIFLCAGSTIWVSPDQLLAKLAAGRPDSPNDVIGYLLWEIRLPRVIAALIVGASLSVAGASFQTLFRNPLADPFVIGVSSAAAVGGVIAAVVPIFQNLPLASLGLAFAAAMAGLLLVIAIGSKGGAVSLNSVLLSGVAIGSFLWAVISFILIMAGQDATRILFWLLGSFSGMDWPRAITVAAVSVLALLPLIRNARPLTIFAVGEQSAGTLGVNVGALKWIVLIAASVLSAAAVSTVGIVGFVGLFVPHICRRIFGQDLRVVFPACLLVGASAVVGADLIAQRLGELNVGIVTALIGAPMLLVLLRKRVHA